MLWPGPCKSHHLLSCDFIYHHTNICISAPVSSTIVACWIGIVFYSSQVTLHHLKLILILMPLSMQQVHLLPNLIFFLFHLYIFFPPHLSIIVSRLSRVQKSDSFINFDYWEGSNHQVGLDEKPIPTKGLTNCHHSLAQLCIPDRGCFYGKLFIF